MTAALVLPDEEQTAAEYAPIIHEASAMLVESDAQYEQAGAFLYHVRASIDQVHELVDPVCVQTNAAHTAATGLRKRLLAPLEESKRLVAARMVDHVHAKKEAARKERLRVALKDHELRGNWIYDDIRKGFTEAQRTDKPLMVVFR